MARKRKKNGSGGKLPLLLTAAAVIAIGGAVAITKSNSNGTGGGKADSFSIADYRQDASRLTGNSYRLEGRVENIVTLGNDRLVAVSLAGNKQERLPLLVRSGVAGKVNLTRGDTFLFDVSCRTGQNAEGEEIKGILIVNKVETK